MKVISLLQPWATLAVIGAKKIETRSWNTRYRGPILIHASASKKAFPLMDHPDFKKYLTPLFITDPRPFLPLGAIIGKVNLIETIGLNYIHQFGKIEVKINTKAFQWDVTKQELAFGDYSADRYGWLLSDPVEFKEPIPVKGKLGLWDYAVDI